MTGNNFKRQRTSAPLDLVVSGSRTTRALAKLGYLANASESTLSVTSLLKSPTKKRKSSAPGSAVGLARQEKQEIERGRESAQLSGHSSSVLSSHTLPARQMRGPSTSVDSLFIFRVAPSVEELAWARCCSFLRASAPSAGIGRMGTVCRWGHSRQPERQMRGKGSKEEECMSMRNKAEKETWVGETKKEETSAHENQSLKET